MRGVLAGLFLLLSSLAISPGTRADSLPPLPATSCDAARPFQGTSTGLPREVSTRARKRAAPPAAALPSAEEAVEEEREATLRPAFHLCVTGNGGLRRAIHRT